MGAMRANPEPDDHVFLASERCEITAHRIPSSSCARLRNPPEPCPRACLERPRSWPGSRPIFPRPPDPQVASRPIRPGACRAVVMPPQTPSSRAWSWFLLRRHSRLSTLTGTTFPHEQPYNPSVQEETSIPNPNSDARPEAVQLELFTHRFAAIARQMGERLQRTAVSTNVKERLDFSCGLLDPAGELVVNAPHIPVHLGALGLCVRRLRVEGPFPTRAVEENLADLRAAVAANHRGAEALGTLAAEHGRETVLRYMAALKARAEERLRAALARLPASTYTALERLDDGAPIAVRIDVAGPGADPIVTVDFAGTAGVH